uniref:Uncharacterized protein n=1 Tax=Coccolithus braarudii TaxID=221442 RepID=A0A7S0LK82_9EUKA
MSPIQVRTTQAPSVTFHSFGNSRNTKLSSPCGQRPRKAASVVMVVFLCGGWRCHASTNTLRSKTLVATHINGYSSSFSSARLRSSELRGLQLPKDLAFLFPLAVRLSPRPRMIVEVRGMDTVGTTDVARVNIPAGAMIAADATEASSTIKRRASMAEQRWE